MKVIVERLPQSQALLTVEAEPAEMEAAHSRAVRHLASRANIPGFRRGKTPPQVVERFLGREAIVAEAADDLVPELYRRAVEQNGLEPVDQPQVELVSTDPIKFKATVPLKPTVFLGDYSRVAVEAEKVEVPDLEVVRGVEVLRAQQAPWQPVENRPVHFGDLLTLAVEIREGDRHTQKEEGLEYLLLPDNPAPVPGFARQLEGLPLGATKEFSLAFPSTDPRRELSGKVFAFKVSVVEAKEKALPPLDDEFAKAAGFESLAALREKVTGDVRSRAEALTRARLEEKVVDAVVAQANLEYPPSMVEREIDRLLDEEASRLRQGHLSLEEYLGSMKKTVGQYRAELRAPADLRLKRALVLGKVAEVEGIAATPEEVDAQIRSLSQEMGDPAQEEALRSNTQLRQVMERRAVARKTVELLVEKARSGREQTTLSGLVLPSGVQLPSVSVRGGERLD